MAYPIGETQLPSQKEIALLDEVIDPLGIRRLEFLSGPQRRQMIRDIIEMEKIL